VKEYQTKKRGRREKKLKKNKRKGKKTVQYLLTKMGGNCRAKRDWREVIRCLRESGGGVQREFIYCSTTGIPTTKTQEKGVYIPLGGPAGEGGLRFRNKKGGQEKGKMMSKSVWGEGAVRGHQKPVS